jgi:glycosyltransferase involved in cell wall biosynthesis
MSISAGRKIRILHVIPSANPKGGGPIEGIKQLFSQYADLGVDAELACCEAPDRIWHNDPGLPKVHAFGPGKTSYAYAPKLTSWLITHSVDYDAVIIDGLWQYHSRAAYLALSKTRVPYFVFPHGMLDPWFKRKYPLKHLKKWLYWPWAEYRVLRDAHSVIFTCEEERLLARESFWLYKANEAVSTHGTNSPPENKIELSRDFLTKHPELKNKRIILFLSRMHEKKGGDLLIEAFARIAAKDDRLHLIMAGPDQAGLQQKLRSLAETLGVSNRITWPGMLQGSDKWGAFYASEVFCLPSHQENFGIVVAEALACGKPVLISNKVNIWREIDSDRAGYVSDDTISGTEQNLLHWLSLSSSEYEALSLRATHCFKTRFHIRRAAERLVEIIKSSGSDLSPADSQQSPDSV